MKQLLFTLCIICSVFFANAQEHLSFKGIPIEGSITTFCQKLMAKGFSQIGKEKNIRLFKGNFTGRNASVAVEATDNGQDVHTVYVIFDESDSWKVLVNTYEQYKDLYIEKYGQPSKCMEYNPSHTETNTSQMLDLNEGKVTYASIFNAPGGSITISIVAGKFYKGFVGIRYEDTQNVNNKRKSDLDEI